MADFAFAKGGDIVVKLGEETLGGVLSVDCKKTVSYVDICEYLNDNPVCRIPRSLYEITLVVNYEKENPFADKTEYDSLKLCFGDATKCFSGCELESIETKISDGSKIESSVVIRAEEMNTQ